MLKKAILAVILSRKNISYYKLRVAIYIYLLDSNELWEKSEYFCQQNWRAGHNVNFIKKGNYQKLVKTIILRRKLSV